MRDDTPKINLLISKLQKIGIKLTEKILTPNEYINHFSETIENFTYYVKMEAGSKILKALKINNAGLNEIPYEVYLFHEIEYLNLSSNQLTSVDEAILELNDLRLLDLSKNKIEQLPDGLFNYSGENGDMGSSKRYEFNFSENNIKIIPKTYLIESDLEGSALYILDSDPDYLSYKINAVGSINLYKNPIMAPPLTALEKRREEAVYQFYAIQDSVAVAEAAHPENALPYSLREIYISGYQGISEVVIEKIEPDTRWIVLTGENGFGKSSVLQAIIILLYGDKEGFWNLDKSGSFKEGYVALKNKDSVLINRIGKYKSVNDCKEYQIKFENFAAYGPSRLQTGKKRVPRTVNIFGFDNELLDIEEELIVWYNKVDNHNLYENFRNILLALLNPYIDSLKVSESNGEYELLYHETKSHQDNWISVEKLASGYRSIISMFGDMILRLRTQQPNVKDAKQLTGLVFIDEFDLHLHPKWQRSLVKTLTDVFPNIQFIVSTHSPIPLLGAPPEQTVILNVQRDDDGDISVKRLKKVEADLLKLTPNQLLSSDIFGLEEIENVYLTEDSLDSTYSDETFQEIKKREEIRRMLNSEYLPSDLLDNI